MSRDVSGLVIRPNFADVLSGEFFIGSDNIGPLSLGMLCLAAYSTGIEARNVHNIDELKYLYSPTWSPKAWLELDVANEINDTNLVGNKLLDGLKIINKKSNSVYLSLSIEQPKNQDDEMQLLVGAKTINQDELYLPLGLGQETIMTRRKVAALAQFSFYDISIS